MTDEEKLARREQEAKEARELREVDADAVMRTVNGRRFVWDFLERISGLHSSSYVPDSDRTIFNEGQRSTGVALLAELQVLVPHLVRRMVAESMTAEPSEAPKHETNQTDV